MLEQFMWIVLEYETHKKPQKERILEQFIWIILEYETRKKP